MKVSLQKLLPRFGLNKSLLLLFLLFWGVSPPVSALLPPPFYADLNRDGFVDLRDLVRLLRFVTGLERPSRRDFVLADIHPFPGTEGNPLGDGKLDVQDAQRLLLFLIGLIPREEFEPEPVVTTVAGSQEGLKDGVGPEAQFNYPFNLRRASNGSLIIADDGNDALRQVFPDTGRVVTLAYRPKRSDLPPPSPEALPIPWLNPTSVTLDPSGNIYVACRGDHRIYRLSLSQKRYTIVAGSGEVGRQDGKRFSSSFYFPYDLEFDGEGNLWVIDDTLLRKITPDGWVRTVAGSGRGGLRDGFGAEAGFRGGMGITVGPDGALYIGDAENQAVRRVTKEGQVITLAGTGKRGLVDGPARQARFNGPSGLCFDERGYLYVADYLNNAIRVITPWGWVATIAGNGKAGRNNGPGRQARFLHPMGVVYSPEGYLYVADTDNNLIRRIALYGRPLPLD